MNPIARLVALGCLLTLAACTSYYKVTDPVSKKDYYTTKVSRQKGGAVEFKDASNGARVTVQNSEVSRIDRAAFKAATPK